MGLNGKGPLIEAAPDWVRDATASDRGSPERERVRRRVRRGSANRSRIRTRIVLVCVVALVIMAAIIQFALQREGASGHRLRPRGGALASASRVV